MLNNLEDKTPTISEGMSSKVIAEATADKLGLEEIVYFSERETQSR
jgi:hypothetical protein